MQRQFIFTEEEYGDIERLIREIHNNVQDVGGDIYTRTCLFKNIGKLRTILGINDKD